MRVRVRVRGVRQCARVRFRMISGRVKVKVRAKVRG